MEITYLIQRRNSINSEDWDTFYMTNYVDKVKENLARLKNKHPLREFRVIKRIEDDATCEFE